MNDKRILSVGVTGTVIAAICCFTPVLVVTLGVLGLSAWIGGLDYVLFPALGICAAVTMFAGWRLWKHRIAQ